MIVVPRLVLFLIEGPWQPSCIIPWVQHFGFKGGVDFFLNCWIAWKTLNFMNSSLIPCWEYRQDCHLTEETLILQLLYMRVWLLLINESRSAVSYLASSHAGGKCRVRELHKCGAASSMAILTMLYSESWFRISLASIKRHNFKLLTSDVWVHHYRLLVHHLYCSISNCSRMEIMLERAFACTKKDQNKKLY